MFQVFENIVKIWKIEDFPKAAHAGKWGFVG